MGTVVFTPYQYYAEVMGTKDEPSTPYSEPICLCNSNPRGTIVIDAVSLSLSF